MYEILEWESNKILDKSELIQRIRTLSPIINLGMAKKFACSLIFLSIYVQLIVFKVLEISDLI